MIILKGAMLYEWIHATEQTFDLCKNSGATVIKNLVYWNEWLNNTISWKDGITRFQDKNMLIRQWCKNKGLLFWLNFDGSQYNPPEGFSQMKANAILDADKKAEWISINGQIISALQPDIVGIMNEPDNNAKGNLTDQEYFNAYRVFLLDCISAWKKIKPNLIFVVDAMPFWDFTAIMANPIPNVIYEVHFSYMSDNTYPPSGEQAQIAYWDGNLALAKTLLYDQLLNMQNIQALINANVNWLMGEIMGHNLNPNVLAYFKDMIDFCKQHNKGFIIQQLRCWDSVLNYYPSGILNNDIQGNETSNWSTLNEIGKLWATEMKDPDYNPPIPLGQDMTLEYALLALISLILMRG